MKTQSYEYVRSRLLNREEIGFLDVREEHPHAQGHPLFAANFPASRIELNAYRSLPRRNVPIVVIDNGEGLAEIAAERLQSLGYHDVSIFDGGIEAWLRSGGELFIDVNVPSKAFGEMVEATCLTPSLPAEDVKELLDNNTDMVIVDVRRFDEYKTMNIPSAINVPGAELVLRVSELVTNSRTKVIVNCAGRTRSLIGTQSLINAGLPNPIAALRNGTIGWTLADQKLEVGQDRQYSPIAIESTVEAGKMARAVADRADVKRVSREQIGGWELENDRTNYFFDVRSPQEYKNGHLPQFKSAPGGQLVQETEMFSPVRGARIVLADDDGSRANMTASWLAQMAWEVYVIDGLQRKDFTETGAYVSSLPAAPDFQTISVEELSQLIEGGNEDLAVVDVSKHAVYEKQHIPGAWYLLRSQFETSVQNLPSVQRYVVTCDDGVLARYIAPELENAVDGQVYVLTGGNQAWFSAGFEMKIGEENMASESIDRYRRPYEGTDASKEAMQAYLDWEFGLIEQMQRDGTHHFQPLT